MIDFGQKVRLVVTNEGGSEVFSSNGLRVDFHTKDTQRFIRGKFDIYNLNTKTISEITSGNNYVKVYTKLHSGLEVLLANTEFYINNAFSEKKVPDNVTSLYCISRLEKDLTNKELNLAVKLPSLTKLMDTIVRQYGDVVKWEAHGFPEGMLDNIPPKQTAILSGAVWEELIRLGIMYNFTYHLTGNRLLIQYHPNERNLHLCNWENRERVVLKDNNMRANVKIGVADLIVHSNLDNNIEPTKMMDTSQLITAGVQSDFATLTVVQGFIKDTIAGSGLYSIITTEHKGSNFTKDWSTKALGVRVDSGTNIDIHNWFGGNT